MNIPMKHSFLTRREIKRNICRSGRLLFKPTVNPSWFNKSSKLNKDQRINVQNILKEKNIHISSNQLNNLTERDALKLIK